jgi:hypothetical protein
MFIYGRNMLWIKIKVTVTFMCFTVTEIYIDKLIKVMNMIEIQYAFSSPVIRSNIIRQSWIV